MTRMPVVSSASSAPSRATRSLRRRASALALALFAVSLGACSAESLTDPIPTDPSSQPTSPVPRNIECPPEIDKCDPTFF